MRVFSTFVAGHSWSNLAGKNFVDYWPVRVHIEIISRLSILEVLWGNDFQLHLLLKQIWKMEKKLLRIMLFIWVEFCLKIGWELFNLLSFYVLIDALLYEFVEDIMEGLFLRILTINILSFEKVVIYLLNRKETLQHWNHVAQI